MNPSQYPMQHQNYYIPGPDQLNLPHQISPDPNHPAMYPSNFMAQQPMNPSFHIENPQNFPNPSINLSQSYQPQPMPINPTPPDSGSNQNPTILMALNFLQAHLVPQPGLRDQQQGYNMTQSANFPMPMHQGMQQGHYSHPGNDSYNQGNGSYGSSPNKFRENGGGYNKDDRGDRRDRGERDRSDNRDRRGYNGNSYHDSDRGKRLDSYSKDRKPTRRSRSRSRSLERKNIGHKNNNSYNNRDRDGGLERKNNDKPRDTESQRGYSDWKCTECGNVNWAWRVECNMCKIKRPKDALLMPNELKNQKKTSFQGKSGFDRHSQPG